MSAFWIAIIATIAIPIAIVLGAMSIIAKMKTVRGNINVAVTPSGSWLNRHPILTTIIIVTVVVISGSILITYGQVMWEWATSVWWVLPAIAFGVVAFYAWKKHGTGKGSLVFIYAVGFALFFTGVTLALLGPEGTVKAFEKMRTEANAVVEKGISFTGESGTTQPTEARATPVEVYDVLVPGRGCSEPAPNTNPQYWINPFPKDARTGWPNLTLVITPKTGNDWVPYEDSMKAYSFIRWCNNTGRKTWMTVEVYKGRL